MNPTARGAGYGANRRALVGAVVAGAVLALVAAGSAAPRASAPSGTGDVVTVGALLDLSRGWTSLGRASDVALALAAADANAELAARRSPVRIRLRVVDVKGDPAETRRALRNLAAAGVKVVVGPQASSEVAAVRGDAGVYGMLLVSQGSTAHTLSLDDDNVFRFVPDDRREAEALVALVRRRAVRALVPIWRNDSGNAGLATSVRQRFSAVGGRMAKGVRYGTNVRSFVPIVAAARRQVNALRRRGVRKVGVYLAGFDEVARLFRVAYTDPVLRRLPWYGSDGVALAPRLVRDPIAARYAARVGYPNPTLGLDSRTAKSAAPLALRIQRRLGSKPDAFALAAYDALRVIADVAATKPRNAGAFRAAFVRTASGYAGASGPIVLNEAGDRAFGSFDFWSVCARGKGFAWLRTASYAATDVGRGRIAVLRRCRAPQ